MHLVSISVEKYRSITKAYKIRLGRSTVIVGPNNEGKSNVVRALVLAMDILTRERLGPRLVQTGRLFQTRRADYEWERDFPVDLQQRIPTGESTIVLEFELTNADMIAFRSEIKSNLNGTLPIRVSIGPKGHYVKVAKQGFGGTVLSRKSAQIAAFVAARIQFEHIPAVRTASSAQHIVEGLVSRELAAVESDPEYIAALSKIADIQQPILDKVSGNIRSTLETFLPDIAAVQVRISQEERFRALRRSYEIIIDDGTATPLELKGDGVQSLAALGIMRHASDSTGKGKNLVIAIEEPESHLHSKAIHELRAVLDEMSQTHQIVLTTHNPLFVNRVSIGSNIVVQHNQARPAKSVEEIREILGVRSSDNLRNAELVLVVEGEDDRQAITHLLRTGSPVLMKALGDNILVLDSLAGSTNLVYKLGLLRNALCLYHCFLDDDDSGHVAFDKARAEGLINDAGVNFASCPGLTEAEFEDLYDPNLYAEYVLREFGASLTGSAFGGNKKWSVRMRDLFKQNGKPWDDRVKSKLKAGIAELAAASPDKALHPARRSSFDALRRSLEQRLLQIHSARP